MRLRLHNTSPHSQRSTAPCTPITVLICLPGEKNQPGGAHQIAQAVANGVAQLGARVYLAFIATNCITIENVATGATARIPIQMRYTIPAILYLMLRSLNIDIVHGHLGVFFWVAWSAWYAGLPSVRTMHGRLDRPGMRTRAERFRTLIAIRLLQQKVIAVSDAVAADLQAIYRMQPQHNLFEIPNSYYLDTVQISAFPIFPPLVFIFVGRFEAIKGFSELIAAFTAAHRQGLPIQLRLIGDGEAKTQLDPALLTAQAIIVSTHWLTPQEVTMALAQAHIFVLPSHSEGFSLALLEAMALGVVPIVSHAANAYGIVRNGINGYTFTTGSQSSLMQIIDYIAAHPEKLEPLRQAAHETVMQQFTLRHASQAHLSLYNWLRYHAS